MSDPNFDPVAMAMAQNALLESVMQRLDEVTRYVDQVWRQAQPTAMQRDEAMRTECLRAAISLYAVPGTNREPKGEDIANMARSFLGFMRGEAGPKAPVLNMLPGGRG